MTKPIMNLDEAVFDDVEENGLYTSRRAFIGERIGARQLGYNLTVLPPGITVSPAASATISSQGARWNCSAVNAACAVGRDFVQAANIKTAKAKTRAWPIGLFFFIVRELRLDRFAIRLWDKMPSIGIYTTFRAYVFAASPPDVRKVFDLPGV